MNSHPSYFLSSSPLNRGEVAGQLGHHPHRVRRAAGDGGAKTSRYQSQWSQNLLSPHRRNNRNRNPTAQTHQPSYVLLTILAMSYCPRFLTLRTVTVELLKVLSTSPSLLLSNLRGGEDGRQDVWRGGGSHLLLSHHERMLGDSTGTVKFIAVICYFE